MPVKRIFQEAEVEEEKLYSEDYEEEITEPFNPKDVDIISQTMVISNIVDQLKYGEIILDPDFQRRPDLWDSRQQSRLIESLMIRLPKESKITLDRCRSDFLKAMKYATEIFGQTPFRKINSNGQYGRINKPLFDAVSVNLAKLTVQDCEQLVKKKDRLLEKYRVWLKDEKFVDIITRGTAAIENVQSRHETIRILFQEVLSDD